MSLGILGDIGMEVQKFGKKRREATPKKKKKKKINEK